MPLINNLERASLHKQGYWSKTTGIIQQTILWGMMYHKGNEPPSSYLPNKILLLFLQKDSGECNIQHAHQDLKYTLQKASWPLDTIGP